MAEKQTNKDRMREIVDSIENGIKELFESDKYRKYLATMSRFHRYSVNNTMLIYMQRPDATHVAGFNKWRDQFGRNVLKGEKGIRIIAPTPYKKKVEYLFPYHLPGGGYCLFHLGRCGTRRSGVGGQYITYAIIDRKSVV